MEAVPKIESLAFDTLKEFMEFLKLPELKNMTRCSKKFNDLAQKRLDMYKKKFLTTLDKKGLNELLNQRVEVNDLKFLKYYQGRVTDGSLYGSKRNHIFGRLLSQFIQNNKLDFFEEMINLRAYADDSPQKICSCYGTVETMKFLISKGFDFAKSKHKAFLIYALSNNRNRGELSYEYIDEYDYTRKTARETSGMFEFLRSVIKIKPKSRAEKWINQIKIYEPEKETIIEQQLIVNKLANLTQKLDLEALLLAEFPEETVNTPQEKKKRKSTPTNTILDLTEEDQHKNQKKQKSISDIISNGSDEKGIQIWVRFQEIETKVEISGCDDIDDFQIKILKNERLGYLLTGKKFQLIVGENPILIIKSSMKMQKFLGIYFKLVNSVVNIQELK